MHPADQVQAFGALADAGTTVADIAARFGVAERTVEQRLRLGNAAPELLDAYCADEIDLDTLKAFAVTADRERQMAVWKRVKGTELPAKRLADQTHAHRGPGSGDLHHLALRRRRHIRGRRRTGRPRPVRRRG